MQRTIAALALALAAPALAQTLTNAFTYQGELANNGQPATGVFDLEFRLFDSATGTTQVGPTLCSDNLSITGGRFAVQLDFGAQFNTQSRYVEVRVRPDTGLSCGSTTGYTTLAPRQPITAAPVSSFSLLSASATTSTSATNATNLNNQPATFYTNAANLTGNLADARLSTNIPRLNAASTFTAIPAFNGGTSGSSAPFSVDSNSLVTNLNADLLDGLEASAFAASSHSHDASALTTGVLADSRISGSFPRLASPNTFTSVQTVSPSTNNILELTTPSISGSWLNLDNTSTNGRRWNLISTGSASTEGVGKLLFRDDTSNLTRLTIDSAGNIGAGTTAPIARLHVNGQLHLQGTAQDITVQSGEALQIGHYDGTTFTERLRLDTSGRLGIGTIPAAPLDVLTSAGQTLQIRQDGAVPGLNVNTTGGNAGIMRLRNAVEVWPSDDATRAGRVDIRNTAGAATISLNGATGAISAANMPAIAGVQTHRDTRDNSAAVAIQPGDSHTLDNLTVNAPASGFLFVTATVNAAVSDESEVSLHFKLDETTNGASTLTESTLGVHGQPFQSNSTRGVVTLHWMLPTGPGSRSFRTGLYNQGNGSQQLYWGHTLHALYIPRGM